MRLINKLLLRSVLNKPNYITKSGLATVIEKRNESFSALSDKDLSFFERLLGKNRCVTDPDMLVGYNTDWLKTVKGDSKLTLLPKTTEELSSILKYCNEKRLAVCPQGGNTGKQIY